jgi:hypothetical protein
VIVEIAFGFGDLKTFCEGGRGQVFRARFTIASRNGHDLQIETASIFPGDPLQCAKRVVNLDDRKVRRQFPRYFLDDGAGRAAFHGFGKKAMAIEVFPAQGEKKIARFE